MLIGIVVMALMGMRNYIIQWNQSMIKVVADQIGSQEDADQQVNEDGARLISSRTERYSEDFNIYREDPDTGKEYGYDDLMESTYETETKLGYTEDNR
jgi:hypothetical protein